MKAFTIFVVLLLSLITCAQTPIENKTLGIHFTPSSQIENTKDLEKFISNLGKVELVYLEGNCYENIQLKGAEPDTSCRRNSIIKKLDQSMNTLSWDSTYFSYRKTLQNQDISDVIELLYGTKFTPKMSRSTVLGCYSPRNGIVFYNTKKEAIGFLEICFECHGFELTSEIPAMKSTITDEELKIFKNLFTKNGIRTTEKDVFEYNRFNLEFKTSKTAEEQEALTQFLNTVYRVEFVRLMGDCKTPDYCRARSIVYEFKDSTFQPKKNYFRQIVKVKKEDLKDLFHIIYKQKEIDHSRTSCYEPRNGILFYDKNNKVFAFFEVCFECRGFETTIQIPKMDRLTTKEFKELKVLFEKYGINTNKD